MKRQRGKWVVLWCLLLSLLLIFTNSAFAKEGELLKKPIQIGRITIKPTLHYSVSGTFNAELSENSDAKYRLVNNIIPGLSAMAAFERLYIETSYSGSFLKVGGYKGKPLHSGRGVVRYDFSDTMSLGLEDDYTTSAVDFTASKKYQLNTARATLAKQLTSRLSTKLAGSESRYKGPSSDRYADYTDNGINLDMDYRLSPLTTLVPQFNWHKRNFNRSEGSDIDSKNYTSWGASLGVGRRITPRLSASVNGGYTRVEYKIDSHSDAITYGAGMNLKLTNFSMLNIDYQHSLEDTFYPLNTDTLQSGSPFLNDETIASLIPTDYRNVTTDRIVANLSFRPTDKDTFDVGFTYLWTNTGSENSLPGNPNRTDNLEEETYTVGFGYSHKIMKWVSLTARAAYGSRKSNMRSGYDYKSYGGGLNLDISF